jgi:hypothetical protein
MRDATSRASRTILHIVLAASAGILWAAAAASQATEDATAPHGAQHAGIWKAAVPPRPMTGEFDNFDPFGVAAGARIKADCSLNWVDPDDGKLYCFSSGTSLEYFLDQPHTNIQRARQRWQEFTAAKQ